MLDTAEFSLDCRDTTPDSRELRRALGRFATGITVVTTCTPSGKREGLTVNSFSSVSLDPPLVLFSLQTSARSLSSFHESAWFAVNVLGSHQHHTSRHFATGTEDKFAGIPHVVGLGGCPLLHDSLARFECSVENRVPAGDHLIFVGRVLRLTHRDGEPLLFAGGRYCVPAPPLNDRRAP